MLRGCSRVFGLLVVAVALVLLPSASPVSGVLLRSRGSGSGRKDKAGQNKAVLAAMAACARGGASKDDCEQEGAAVMTVDRIEKEAEEVKFAADQAVSEARDLTKSVAEAQGATLEEERAGALSQ